MNMSQFGHERHQKDSFQLLQWHARYDFQTESSISFCCTKRVIIRSWPFFGYFFAWLDVRYHVDPQGKVKVYLRVLLPPKYYKVHQRHKIVKRVFDVLEIPPGTANEACFVTTEKGRILGSKDPTMLAG